MVGLFSFLALLACESGTARFRAGLVPIHAIMGTATFIMALATAICGLMERAFLSYRWEINSKYHLSQTILTSLIKYKLYLLAGAFRRHSGQCALQCGCERPTIPQCHLWHDGSPGHPDASYPLVPKIQIQDTTCLKVKMKNSFYIIYSVSMCSRYDLQWKAWRMWNDSHKNKT